MGFNSSILSAKIQNPKTFFAESDDLLTQFVMSCYPKQSNIFTALRYKITPDLFPPNKFLFSCSKLTSTLKDIGRVLLAFTAKHLHTLKHLAQDKKN